MMMPVVIIKCHNRPRDKSKGRHYQEMASSRLWLVGRYSSCTMIGLGYVPSLNDCCGDADDHDNVKNLHSCPLQLHNRIALVPAFVLIMQRRSGAHEAVSASQG